MMDTTKEKIQSTTDLAYDFSNILPAPELTIIVPTFNEKDNVPILIDRLRKTLEGYDWEVIFVDDDSPDKTADLVRTIGKQDRRVRCIRRVNRRGLSGAFIEGALASQASYVAVIDGDLQHDESLLTTMLDKFNQKEIELVVATRYADGGSLSSFSAWRARFSNWATALARRFLGVTISDPMSGFFMIRRTVIERIAPQLRTQGFKILLDIITTASGKLHIAEVPYSFRKREHGKSKLDARIVLDFASLIIGKLTAGIVSARFILFSFVGLIGLVLHIVLLNIGLHSGFKFGMAQMLSTVLIIACNFILNNILTYGDQRLSGIHFLSGLFRFEIICSVGLISNVGVATWIYNDGNTWWLAGLSGAVMGVIWNYMVSAALVWKR